MDEGMLKKWQMVRKWGGGILFTMSLFFSALLGFVVLSPVYIIGFALRLQCGQWIYDTIISTWFAFAVGAYEVIYGVRIVIQGDVRAMSKDKCSLIVMNHRTRLDWLFYFAVQARYASLRRFKISLKNELRHIPGAGWAMQAAKFLFLKRRWSVDRDKIVDYLSTFVSYGMSPQLLLFPEGTDFQQLSRQRSRQYAEQNELSDYSHVLHPRTLGFTSVVGYMKEYNKLDQIIDVTVAYPENVLQTETALITGDIPRVIVFTINCFDIDTVPTENEARLAQWLEHRWRLKEETLKEFYVYKDYSGENGLTAEQNLEIERDTKLYLVAALVFWVGLCLSCVCLLLLSHVFRVCVLWGLLICLLVSSFVGFDTLFNSLAVFPDM